MSHISQRPLFLEPGALNVSKLDYSAKMDMKFRRIVNKAMERAGVKDLDDKASFIEWAIGKDYKTVPYQDWPARLTDRVKLIGIWNQPVVLIIQAAAEIWKRKRIVVGMN